MSIQIDVTHSPDPSLTFSSPWFLSDLSNFAFMLWIEIPCTKSWCKNLKWQWYIAAVSVSLTFGRLTQTVNWVKILRGLETQNTNPDRCVGTIWKPPTSSYLEVKGFLGRCRFRPLSPLTLLLALPWLHFNTVLKALPKVYQQSQK